MPSMDIFNNDAFNMQSLTAAINEAPYKPGRIGALGLFGEDGISTLSLSIEKIGTKLALVPAGERGTVATRNERERRDLIDFRTVHLPKTDQVLADEVIGLRAFGTETELELVQNVVNRRLAKCRDNIDVTIEYQRIGAIRGQLLDADGKGVLVDLYDRFGITQPSQAMALGSGGTKVRAKVNEALRKMEEGLGNALYKSARVLCSDAFFDAFCTHDNVEKFYLNYQEAADQRGDVRRGFLFGGVFWENYRGKVGDIPFIPDGKAYMVPEGVPDLFITRYAPADYVECVGTIGLPYYAKQELKPMGKGVDIETQSNPISLCTRPGAVVELSV